MLFVPQDGALKLRAGKLMVTVTIQREGDRLLLGFPFNRALLEEVKAMQGAKWHGFDDERPRKIWSIPDTRRNRFQLAALAFPSSKDPRNPYSVYDVQLVPFSPTRALYAHQCDLCRGGLTYHYCIWSAEMGTGKTLAAIEVMEASGCSDWIWVGPKSALVSVKLEFRKWRSRITPLFVTYDGLKKLLADWPQGKPAPQGLILDEASRCKNYTAQRTQACQYLADRIRDEWGQGGFVIEMSGSPAPNNPTDWWSICEIACPGFLREGSPEKLRKRLAIMESRESFTGGGSYSHLVAWRDSEDKCDVCGLPRDSETHSDRVDVHQVDPTCHPFRPSVNEVSLLYRRMRGLMMVKFKRDCLDLPEKVYRVIRCRPTQSTINAMRAIQAKASTTIEALTLCRELSDGFQYSDVVEGTQECPHCHGRKIVQATYDRRNPDDLPTAEEFEKGHRLTDGGDGRLDEIEVAYRDEACRTCSGTGSVSKYVRTATQIPCPKEEVLKNLLDEHDDVGRIVIYGGFTGSVDRVASVVQAQGWQYIRVDGRGWHSDLPFTQAEFMLEAFQNRREVFERVAFIGQPSAAGMGLTLTASPTILYYSNDFNAESRIQSEDRIHRPGMDVNRGATIIDVIHLPSDELVLNNLRKKRRLQDMTMGELGTSLQAAEMEMLREF